MVHQCCRLAHWFLDAGPTRRRDDRFPLGSFADRFGTAKLSGVMRLHYTSVAIGTLVGPVAAGLVARLVAAAIAAEDSVKVSQR